MKKDFIFYEVKIIVDKGHEHYTFKTKTFIDQSKAYKYALKQGVGKACVVAILTNGEDQFITACSLDYYALYRKSLEVFSYGNSNT